MNVSNKLRWLLLCISLGSSGALWQRIQFLQSKHHMCYFCANSLADFDPWMFVAAPQLDIVYHPVEVMNAYCHDADHQAHWDVQVCSEPACATFQVLPHKGGHAFTIRGCADYILKRPELYRTDRAQSKCYQLPNSTLFNASFTLCTCASQLCNVEAATTSIMSPASSSSNPRKMHEIEEGSGEDDEPLRDASLLPNAANKTMLGLFCAFFFIYALVF